MAYETLSERWFEEVWNQGKESTIDELWPEDAVAHGLTDTAGNNVLGLKAFKEFFWRFRNAFPDLHVSIEEVLTKGDLEMVRCHVTGTHTGPGFTAVPTNGKISFSGMSLAKIRDGKLAEAWNNFDFLSMYQQLGLKLAPAEA
jgi:steroid delta-isomerase-like uncharacterized protein